MSARARRGARACRECAGTPRGARVPCSTRRRAEAAVARSSAPAPPPPPPPVEDDATVDDHLRVRRTQPAGVPTGVNSAPAGAAPGALSPLPVAATRVTCAQVIFAHYCHFGRTSGAGSSGASMDGGQFAKLARDSPGLLGAHRAIAARRLMLRLAPDSDVVHHRRTFAACLTSVARTIIPFSSLVWAPLPARLPPRLSALRYVVPSTRSHGACVLCFT